MVNDKQKLHSYVFSFISCALPTVYGVPQGCILGALIKLIYLRTYRHSGCVSFKELAKLHLCTKCSLNMYK